LEERFVVVVVVVVVVVCLLFLRAWKNLTKFDHEMEEKRGGSRALVGRKGIVLSVVVVTNVSSRFKKSLLLLLLLLTAQREREERKGKRVFLCQFQFPLIEQRESRQLRTDKKQEARARAALFKKTFSRVTTTTRVRSFAHLKQNTD